MTDAEIIAELKRELAAENKRLKEENARLNEVLKRHGITLLKEG